MNISELHDDCLSDIFKYLSGLDKLRLSLVCRKWGYYLMKKLEINDSLVKDYVQVYDDKKEFTNFLVNILKKCGPYIKTLIINMYVEGGLLSGFEISEIILKMSKYCKNIQDIKISGCDPIENLELLFKNNINLRNINLENLFIEGNCFAKSHPLKIESFKINDVIFETENYIIKFISKLKNLKIFYMNAYDVVQDTIDVIRALDSSDCENISDFALNDCESSESTEELLNLLLKQKKLRKLSLFGVNVTTEFLDKLKKNDLEMLKIAFKIFNNLEHYPISEFKNLRELHCALLELTDEVMNGIKDCTYLEYLFLNVLGNCLLTKAGESNFSKFKSLKTFRIHCMEEKNIDNILVALSQCKNIEKIIFNYFCQFTDSGLNSISLLPNLKELVIPFSDVTDKQLGYLVKNAKKLETLDINDCNNVTNRFIEEASEVKQRRNDKHYLTIIYLTVYEIDNGSATFTKLNKINTDNLKNISPLILLKAETIHPGDEK